MIQISEIRNADLKSLAKSIDNGDKKLSNVELHRLISGVSTLQNNRLYKIDALKEELEFLENQSAPSMAPPGTGKAFGALGLGVLSFFTGKKMGKALKLSALACFGFALYDLVEYKSDISKTKKEIKNLRKDSNLNSMASEVKDLVGQMAGDDSNAAIAKYLAKNDGGKRPESISAGIWNNYVNAVFGVLRDTHKKGLNVRSYISEQDAVKSLNLYDEYMKENK